MSSTAFPPEMATRPSSISNTPRIAVIGLNGRPASQELFTYNLELALLSVLQKEDEYGRDAIFKWRSEKELYQNAWSTPTYWDWSSSGSASSYVSEASTPGVSTPCTIESEEEISFEPPRAWSMIRNQIEAKVIKTIKPASAGESTPLKRKFDDESDDDEWLHPRKKARCDSKHVSFSINELTPPSSPPSDPTDIAKDDISGIKSLHSSPKGLSYGEITPPEMDDKTFQSTLSSFRHSKKLKTVPP